LKESEKEEGQKGKGNPREQALWSPAWLKKDEKEGEKKA